MSVTILLIVYVISLVVGLIILYYVVKAAVRDGIRESRLGRPSDTYQTGIPPRESSATPQQSALQERYDKGEISFEQYQAEWNKLKS